MQFHRIHQVILMYAPPSESAPPKRHMDRFVRICSAHDLHITHTHTERRTCVGIAITIINTTMCMVLSSWPKSLWEFNRCSSDVCRLSAGWPPTLSASYQANRLGLWVRRTLAATIHIHHRHCYCYSARKLIFILSSHGEWKAESI